jgi:hypothetical protein
MVTRSDQKGDMNAAKAAEPSVSIPVSSPRKRPVTARVKRSEDSKSFTSRPVSAPATQQPGVLGDANEKEPRPLSSLSPPAPGNEHRRYSSVYPCANKLLAKRWDDAARERHRRKLATIKTYIDNTPPKKHGHLQLRLKKLQLEDGTCNQIKNPLFYVI